MVKHAILILVTTAGSNSDLLSMNFDRDSMCAFHKESDVQLG